MIDDNLNKKKKQPKFVVEEKYDLEKVKWVESLPADLIFMDTCRLDNFQDFLIALRIQT